MRPASRLSEASDEDINAWTGGDTPTPPKPKGRDCMTAFEIIPASGAQGMAFIIESHDFEVTPSGAAIFYGRVPGSSREIVQALSPSAWSTITRIEERGAS